MVFDLSFGGFFGVEPSGRYDEFYSFFYIQGQPGFLFLTKVEKVYSFSG